jgi:sugar phosphate isomerase/epimerase
MKQYSLGLCSVSFRKHTPLEILSEMQKASLQIIEWGSDIHAPADNEKALSDLVKLQQEYGVTCSSYGTYFRIGITPAEELSTYIHAAKILGTKTLRLWAGNKDSRDFDGEEKEAFFKECRLLAELAEAEGVKLCMECHNKTYTNFYQSALELMQKVNSDHFRMYWQPNQFREDDENVTAAKLLSPYTENIHIFHWQGKEKLPLSEGKEIWKTYLSHFSGKETLLLEFMPDGKLSSLKREADAARKILEELQ